MSVPAKDVLDRSAGWGVLTVACVSALVVNANTSAVTILLPAISEDLNAPISQLQWAVTVSYRFRPARCPGSSWRWRHRSCYGRAGRFSSEAASRW